MIEKKLSVIVGVYNPDLLKFKKCIQSIVNQTYRNLEVILLDDGSSNGSEKICDDFASQDERIRVIHQENYGTHAKFEVGYLEASGDYITNVDHDDYLELDYYEQLMKVANEKSIDVIDSGYYHHDWRSGTITLKYAKEYIEIVGEYEIVDFASRAEVAIDTWCYIFKRELAKKGEDWNLINDLSFVGATTLVHLPYAGYHFVNVVGTTSSGRLNKWYIDQVKKFFSTKHIDYTLKKYPFLVNYIDDNAIAWLKRGYFYMIKTTNPTDLEKQLIQKMKVYLKYDKKIARRFRGISKLNYFLITHKFMYVIYKLYSIKIRKN
ncbi:MAG: glycosyltransferase [Streptococcaceae bacterium]|nr:glycosyltransferase [Streptococcaceae bacterium]